MKSVVFYSWQSDLANATNRSLIESALRDAAKEIANDESIDIEPVIDRDTQGVAGAPDIATTIFEKIAVANIFVADISLVLNGKKRSTPNPNVLIELGYALGVLGHERIVLVFNEASGKKEKLPFDLKTRRILTYHTAETDTDRSVVKATLTQDLKAALLSGFSHTEPPKQSPVIVDLIKNNASSKKIDLREHLARVLNDLDKQQPPMRRDGGTVEQLIASLPNTEQLVMDFAKLSETVVLMNDMDSAKEIFQWFGKALSKYDPVRVGTTWNTDGDFFKFVGHELFVVFISPFVREEKWKELHELLKGTLRVGPRLHYQSETKESWTKLSEHLPSLSDEGKKRQRMSLHADILKERHENRTLGQVSPLNEFSSADFFLYLHGESSASGQFNPDWYPRSVLWLSGTPRFVSDAEDYPTAMKICHALGINDTDEFKNRLTHTERLEHARHFPITSAEINQIGSKGGATIIMPSS